MEIQTGDWIMFLRDRKTVIDLVVAIKENEIYPYGDYVLTPHYGSVLSKEILEKRKKEVEDI